MATDAAAVLVADRLSVRFGGFQALQDVSWSARAGRILGIIGPNGAGKSTCFLAATNMVPHDGRLHLDGRDVTGLRADRLPPLGVRRTFQQNAFFGGMTVRDNLVGILGREGGTPLALSVFAPMVERRRRRRMEALARTHLLRFGIPEAAHGRLPGELPYGTQRMLSIALACAPGMRVVLLDEPGAGLGGADLAGLRDLLVSLRDEGVAVVLIEHHMDLVMGVADEVLVIEQGRAIACGPPSAVQADPAVLEAYLGRAA
ncbi:MAG: ATP-binding cassette domain-containing protein [Acetobacteraceae bacterium]